MCGENYYSNINIKTLNFIMNKDQLIKLQQKVNRLMQVSSDDSDTDKNVNLDIFQKRTYHQPQLDAQTVKKCVNLMNQNKQLKIQLERERKESQQLRRQLEKTKRQNKQQTKTSQIKEKQKKKLDQNQIEQKKKVGRLQAQLQQAKKRNKRLQQILINERKKCNRLCAFINKHVPELEQSVDKLTAKLDAKLQSHFSQVYDF